MVLSVIGHGYVGLVTAAVFADLGNTVWVIGHTPEKIENLEKGIIPIYEPGLKEVVKRNLKARRLLFTLKYTEAIPASSIVFIAVGTPPKKNGEADLSVVFSVAKKIGEHLGGYTVVATKSTVPVGTNRKIKEIISQAKTKRVNFDIASVPEFLREGQAISDTLHPDRIVIGTELGRARNLLLKLHKPIDSAFILTNLETAEMIKYISNAFLATKISFANAIAQLSELTGSDGLKVLEAVGLDKRIGDSFLSPGAGYGGSCLPKDIKALIAIAQTHKYDFGLLREVEEINNAAMMGIVLKAKKMLGGSVKGKRIGILGLAFKPDTDDMRDAPAIYIIKKLQNGGAKISAYDPAALTNARKVLKNIEFCHNPYDICRNADILVILTEWKEFRELDLLRVKKLMKKPFILDGRNIYDRQEVERLGFQYQGVGR